jgi:catechol 2,3-dioxygenase-like lactoylglutathione lyase family enzyme
MEATMTALKGIHHVKLPVADPGRSRDWYVRTLGLEVEFEVVEEGQLRGVVLRDPSGSVCLAVRHAPERASALDGFDPLALAVGTRDDLAGWQEHLDGLGEPHGDVVAGKEGWVLVGLHDPDGIEVRLYTLERHTASSGA